MTDEMRIHRAEWYTKDGQCHSLQIDLLTNSTKLDFARQLIASAGGEMPVAWRVRPCTPDNSEEWRLLSAGGDADYLSRRGYEVQPLYGSAQHRLGGNIDLGPEDDLPGALRMLIKYARWQVKEGADYHPTLPSAIAQAQHVLSEHNPNAARPEDTINELALPGESERARPLSSDTGDGAADAWQPIEPATEREYNLLKSAQEVARSEYERGWKAGIQAAVNVCKGERDFSNSLGNPLKAEKADHIAYSIGTLKPPTAPSISKRSV